MTLEEMESLFNKHSGEYIKFERIVSPRHRRPDLCAFLMIDDLIPGSQDLIGCAEHDEFYLSVTTEDLAEAITEDIIKDLIRCGLQLDKRNGFYFFA